MLGTIFLEKDLTRNKFLSTYTKVEYTIVFSPFDNILWKLSFKLIENVRCTGTKSFPINISVQPKVHECASVKIKIILTHIDFIVSVCIWEVI